MAGTKLQRPIGLERDVFRSGLLAVAEFQSYAARGAGESRLTNLHTVGDNPLLVLLMIEHTS